MATKNDVENLRLRSSDDLCRLAEMIGYGKGRFQQLACSNGAYVSSLLKFFDDNPGAMEAVQEFILNNIESYEVDEDEEECDDDV